MYGKLTKFPNYTLNLPENCPNFRPTWYLPPPQKKKQNSRILHDTCPRKIPEFYMIIARKIFSRFWGEWGACPAMPPFPNTPMSACLGSPTYLAGDLYRRQSIILGSGRVTKPDVRGLVVDVIDDDPGATRWRHVWRHGVVTSVGQRHARVKLVVETFHNSDE